MDDLRTRSSQETETDDLAAVPLGERGMRRPALATLMIASGLSPLAINIFLPSMASIASDLSADGATIGLGLSLYLIATAVVQLVAGPLSDKFGRRPVILGGMILFLVGTAMCLLASSVHLFLLGRVVQAASATGIGLSRAIVRDVYDKRRAASMIGYVTMGLAVAPMIGPLIGGMLDTAFGWRSVFWLLAILGVMTIALLLVDLSETNQARGRPVLAQLASYRALLGDRELWAFVGSSAFTSGVFFAFIGGAPLLAVNVFGMTPAGYGLWFTLCALGYMLGNFAAGRFSERLGVKRMMVTGSAINVLGVSLSATAAVFGVVEPAALFAPMLLVGFGNGMALPSATAGGVSIRPEAAGAAAGLLGALQVGLGAFASVLAAHVATGSWGMLGLTLVMLGFGLPGLAASLAAGSGRRRA